MRENDEWNYVDIDTSRSGDAVGADYEATRDCGGRLGDRAIVGTTDANGRVENSVQPEGLALLVLAPGRSLSPAAKRLAGRLRDLMTEWSQRAAADELDDPTLSKNERIARKTSAMVRRNSVSELRLVLSEFLNFYRNKS